MATVVIEAKPGRRAAAAPPAPGVGQVGALAELRHYVRSQIVNAKRHGQAVRGFNQGEFGDGPTAPRLPNVQA
jgi:hypothetical protein